jgi:hypothetical protein
MYMMAGDDSGIGGARLCGDMLYESQMLSREYESI